MILSSVNRSRAGRSVILRDSGCRSRTTHTLHGAKRFVDGDVEQPRRAFAPVSDVLDAATVAWRPPSDNEAGTVLPGRLSPEGVCASVPISGNERAPDGEGDMRRGRVPQSRSASSPRSWVRGDLEAGPRHCLRRET